MFDDEQRFGGLAIRQVLNSEGLRLELSAGYGPSKPGNGLNVIETDTSSLTVNGILSYPFIRSRQQNLYLEGGFQSIDQKVDALDENITDDSLRVLFASLLYDFNDEWGGLSQVSMGIRQGFEGLGSSKQGDPNLSQLGGVPGFTSINAYFSRNQFLWNNFSLYLAGIGQYGFNNLLTAEEFILGGERFGRGYNPAELAGDSGLGLSTELQYTIPGPFKYWQSMQGYGFYDYGKVWNRGREREDHQSLASAGFGIRNQVLRHVFVDLEVAWPLTLQPQTFDSKGPRFFFQVLTRF